MKKRNVFLGSVAALGVALGAACGSSSSNGGGPGNGGDGGSSSGGSSSGGSDASGGGSACSGSQVECVGLTGTTCISPGASCVGTTVIASECSATVACPGGQVCCSSIVAADGGAIAVPDLDAAAADFDGNVGNLLGNLGNFTLTVAVQCMAQCPSGGESSQVCSLDDAATGPACPEGTTCRDLLPAFLASSAVPNTLCLAPVPDAGTLPRFDGGRGGNENDAAADSGQAPVVDAGVDAATDD